MLAWLYICDCVVVLYKPNNPMDTQQIADRLVALCREGKNADAINELYGDNIVSCESMGDPREITGKAAVIEKNQDWFNSVEELHSTSVSEPLVAGDFFTVAMSFDVTFKKSGRMQMDEIALYEVKDGKIVMDHFFYAT
jgi:ketosteroid isomerase-like protein